ncbi:hypothetical protein [Rhodococcus sp. UNC363MFTsu5.1]|uniref:hypothetical protein n=1 Tax=Rhodococcus sp. UNC363MFTsu5.1 TaxID=1449069 RepID=UPI00048220D7|nr:hypothetical protein [Rhodococcus sp. UNC363MFTsu5.1]
MTNFTSFLGSYSLNFLLARLRCYLEISGGAEDLSTAQDVLQDMGWRRCEAIATAAPTPMPTRLAFVRDIRGSRSLHTQREVADAVNQRLTDALLAARVYRIALVPIRYPSAEFNHEKPAVGGLTVTGLKVDRLATIRYPARTGDWPSGDASSGDSTPKSASGSRWRADAGHAVYGWLDRQARRELPFGLSARLTAPVSAQSRDGEDSPRLRKWIWAWIGAVLMLAIVLAFRVEFNTDTPAGPWMVVAIFGVMFLVVGVPHLLLKLLSRIALEPAIRAGALPASWSPYSYGLWIDGSDPVVLETMSVGRANALHRIAASVMTVSRVFGLGVCGALVFWLIQFARDSPDALAIPVGLAIFLIWSVIRDIVRSRGRRQVRSVAVRVFQFLLVLGLGGVLLKLPTFAFYYELGATDMALTASWIEVVWHAAPVLAMLGAMSLVAAVAWVLTPRMEKWSRDLFSLGMAINVLCAAIAGVVIAIEPAANARDGMVESVTPAFKAMCSLDGDQWIPTWRIGRTDPHFYAKRIVSDDQPNIDLRRLPTPKGSFIVDIDNPCNSPAVASP